MLCEARVSSTALDGMHNLYIVLTLTAQLPIKITFCCSHKPQYVIDCTNEKRSVNTEDIGIKQTAEDIIKGVDNFMHIRHAFCLSGEQRPQFKGVKYVYVYTDNLISKTTLKRK